MSFTERTVCVRLLNHVDDAFGYGTRILGSPATIDGVSYRFVVPVDGISIRNCSTTSHTFYLDLRSIEDVDTERFTTVRLAAVTLGTGETYYHPGRVVLANDQELYVYSGDAYGTTKDTKPVACVTFAEVSD